VNVVLQRYLLEALTTPQSFSASGTGTIQAKTVSIPLSGKWTIRLRSIMGGIQPSDNSGQLQLLNLSILWQLLDSGNNQLFAFGPTNSLVTPPTALPKDTTSFVQFWGDADQIVSSFDNVGAVIMKVAAIASVTCTNNDAAAAHSAVASCFAVLEFEAPGAS
jgi:hypothetical protein